MTEPPPNPDKPASRLIVWAPAAGVLALVLAAGGWALLRQRAGRGGLRLVSDARYAAALEKVYAEEPAADADGATRLTWLRTAAHAEWLMRNYAAAEEHHRKSLELAPDTPVLHANLSVTLGKMGRYREAAAEARKALALPGVDAMHANMVLACWEWELGQGAQARARVKSVAVPARRGDRRLYYGCLACFRAQTGDEKATEAAMKQALALDSTSGSRAFFERDVAFDPYRKRAWFIRLVGETLAK